MQQFVTNYNSTNLCSKGQVVALQTRKNGRAEANKGKIWRPISLLLFVRVRRRRTRLKSKSARGEASVFVELFVLHFFQIKIESREIYWKVSGNRSHLPQNPADPPKTTNTSGRLMVDTRFSKFRKVFWFFLIDSGPNDFCERFRAFYISQEVFLFAVKV